MRNAPALLALCLTLLGAGCATFPDLDRIDMGAPAAEPALVPLEPLLDAAPATRATPAQADDLTARAAALRARAAALQRRGAIPATARARMAAGVAPPG